MLPYHGSSVRVPDIDSSSARYAVLSDIFFGAASLLLNYLATPTDIAGVRAKIRLSRMSYRGSRTGDRCT